MSAKMEKDANICLIILKEGGQVALLTYDHILLNFLYLFCLFGV